jgi:hypothetical protein
MTYTGLYHLGRPQIKLQQVYTDQTIIGFDKKKLSKRQQQNDIYQILSLTNTYKALGINRLNKALFKHYLRQNAIKNNHKGLWQSQTRRHISINRQFFDPLGIIGNRSIYGFYRPFRLSDNSRYRTHKDALNDGSNPAAY